MLLPSTEVDRKIISEQKLFIVWSFAVFMMTMNTTMFNVALPVIQEDLMINVSLASWIISGYSMTLAVSTLTFSRLSEYISISKLVMTGLLFISFGSMIGFFSTHYIFILITRILQAVGAGAVVSLAVVVITRYIPASRRARTLALTSSASVFGLGLGPVIGGIIVEVFGWNYLFLLTAAVLFLLPVFQSLLPREEKTVGSFDSLGCTLASFAIISLMVFFSTFHVAFAILSVVLLMLSGRHFNRAKEPFINMELLRSIPYVSLLFISFIAFFVFFSSLFMVPLILHDLHQLEALGVGFLVLPGGILSVFAARTIGRLIDRFGNSNIIFAAQGLFIVSILIFIFLADNSSLFVMLAYLLMSPAFTAYTTSSRNEVPHILAGREAETGVGIVQMVQFLGGAFGVTISGALLNMQSGLAAVDKYDNVYIVLLVLIFSGMGLLYWYQRRGKVGDVSR